MKLVKRIIIILGGLLALLVIGSIGFVYLAPESATRFFISLERKQAGLERKEIDLPDGTRYVYLEGGQGEPIMLLHGFGANKDSFDRVAKFLTPKYKVIIPDHVGFGESSHPPEADYTAGAQAARLHSLVEALGIKEIHIGGNSMGGQIALLYAARYSTEVKSLWLQSPAGIWSAPKSEIRLYFEETGQNPLIVKTEKEFARLFPWVMAEPPYIPGPIMNVIAQERIQNHDLEVRILEQIINDSVEDRVRGLMTPALIVWGEKDRTINVATAPILNALLPKSQVVIMKDIGHAPAIEQPQQSAEDYMRFRDGL